MNKVKAIQEIKKIEHQKKEYLKKISRKEKSFFKIIKKKYSEDIFFINMYFIVLFFVFSLTYLSRNVNLKIPNVQNIIKTGGQNTPYNTITP